MQHTRSGQLKWDGAAKLTPSSFDADQPAAFYLLDNREGMEALADATLEVQGVELPVHSQVTGRWLAVVGGGAGPLCRFPAGCSHTAGMRAAPLPTTAASCPRPSHTGAEPAEPGAAGHVHLSDQPR